MFDEVGSTRSISPPLHRAQTSDAPRSVFPLTARRDKRDTSRRVPAGRARYPLSPERKLHWLDAIRLFRGIPSREADVHEGVGGFLPQPHRSIYIFLNR